MRALDSAYGPGGKGGVATSLASKRRDVVSPVYVELAPRRREAVTTSGNRTGGVVRDGEQGPVHGSGVEDVQIVEEDWKGEG